MNASCVLHAGVRLFHNQGEPPHRSMNGGPIGKKKQGTDPPAVSPNDTKSGRPSSSFLDKEKEQDCHPKNDIDEPESAK